MASTNMYTWLDGRPENDGADNNSGELSQQEQSTEQNGQPNVPKPTLVESKTKPEKLKTAKEIFDAYNEVYCDYIDSEAKAELEKLLTPMIGKIDRVVTVGLGSPSTNSENIFMQVAMIEAAYEILRGEQEPKHAVELFQCDPAATTLDREFLDGQLGIIDIPYDQDRRDADTRPDKYSLRIRGQDYEHGTWEYKAPVEHVFEYVTSTTLLFMPHLPISPILRYVRGTSPAMIITNAIEGMWNYVVLKQPENGYIGHESTKPFLDQWKEEYEAWVKLKVKFKRKHLIEHKKFIRRRSDGFFAYVPLGDEKVDGSWATEDDGLRMNLEDAVDSFIHD